MGLFNSIVYFAICLFIGIRYIKLGIDIITGRQFTICPLLGGVLVLGGLILIVIGALGGIYMME